MRFWVMYVLQIIGSGLLLCLWSVILRPLLSGDDNQETGDEDDDENVTPPDTSPNP